MKDMNYWELRKRFAPISYLVKQNCLLSLQICYQTKNSIKSLMKIISVKMTVLK